MDRKYVLLLRHAKSSWEEADLRDYERPLNKRGRDAAVKMGVLAKEKELVPELILASPAVRSRSTVKLFVKACGYQGCIRYPDTLYLAEPADIIAVLKSVSEAVSRVMVVGHNPGLEDLLAKWVSFDEKFPTAALAVVKLPLKTWTECGENISGELCFFYRPREI